MADYEKVSDAIQADERYRRNLDWGVPRKGHPEGTVRAHIAELEGNLIRLRPKLTDVECARLKLLIHAHDTFKAEAKRGVPIADPASHASIARQFLANYCDDEDLLNMVQYHDEPYALWRQFTVRASFDEQRLAALIERISDWDLFLAFLIIDGCTEGKSREPLVWFFEHVGGKLETELDRDDIL
jgi:hypothetical protein